MEQAVMFAVIGIVVASLFLGVVGWRWIQDYWRPQWRRLRWRAWPDRVISYQPAWQAWWAWRPVRTLSNQVVWLTTIYRTPGNDYVDHNDWRWYHYADEFDLLKWA
jgi:hypothetical protein